MDNGLVALLYGAWCIQVRPI